MDSLITSDYQVLTKNGFQDFCGIKKTLGKTIMLKFEDGTVLECSWSHKLLDSDENFVPAIHTKIGNVYTKKLVSKTILFEEKELYDLLEVSNGHNFLTNSITSSNCAFVRKGVWKEFASSTFPTISSGKETKMVLVSTPNGKNHFYEIWTKAIEKKSSFFPIRVDWWEVPGRDEKWKKEQIANTSQEQFDQEFGNSFLATSGTLIPSEHLVRIETEIKEPIQYSKDLKIYELPQYGHEYFCSVDCASTGKDYSTIQVIDISSKPWKQVAVYRNNVISHLVFPTVINMLGTKYNTASVLVENNEIGNTILHILNYEIEYDNIISTRINQKQVSLGQRTTTKTKSIGCQRLKDMISAEMITIVDFNTLTELRHFVQSKESYAAERGETDDLVMPLVNFAYFSSTEKFKYLFDKSFTEEFRNKYEEDIYESLAPMPMFNTTASEESENLDWLKN